MNADSNTPGKRRLARPRRARELAVTEARGDQRPDVQPARDEIIALGPVSLRPYLWRVIDATCLVAVYPIVIVSWLRIAGVVRSTLFGMLLAIGLSLGASHLGRASWERRADTGDLLYDELMVWGFIRRWRNERRLASALKLLGSMHQAQSGIGGGLSAESQAKALEQLSSALEARDPNTHGHSRRVARHAWMIAKRMGLSREQVARIRTAAAVHDVGKLRTPESVLRKPGALSDTEFALIKRHPVDGAKMVAALGDAQLTAIVRHHHERLDGTGYPSRLSGGEIPLGARIIAVADTFDAITSARAYRPARPHAVALEILKREAGTQLDPAAVRAFCGFYAGRRPLLAGWASLTSLPAQALTSLGGVATATKALAVAAVFGTAAAGTATLARPATDRHPARRLATVHVRSTRDTGAVSRPAPRPTHGKEPSPDRHIAAPVLSGRHLASARAPLSRSADASSAVVAVVTPASGGSSSPSATQQPPSTAHGEGVPPAEEPKRSEPPPHKEPPQKESPQKEPPPHKEPPQKESPQKEPPHIEPPHIEPPHIEPPHIEPVHK
jgi:putative nucleotidyltransferase with HDIG domain